MEHGLLGPSCQVPCSWVGFFMYIHADILLLWGRLENEVNLTLTQKVGMTYDSNCLGRSMH